MKDLSYEEKISSTAGSNIIKEISAILKEKKVDYSETHSQIIVKNLTKKKVIGYLKSIAKENDLALLVDIVETKKKVYIRKRIR